MRPEHWLYTIPLRLRSLFRRSQADQELDEELGDHLERRTEEYVARGMAQAEAHRRARLDLSGIEQTKEKCRDARRVNWIQDLVQDLRYGLRSLRKSPGYACAAIVVLALGICASISIFAFVDAALIKPLPYRDSNHLVGVFETNVMFRRSNLSYPDYLDWKKLNRVFRSFDAYQATGVLVTTSAGTRRALGARVTEGFFRTLGVTPLLGHDFYAGEDLPSAARTVLLSYSEWKMWYGGRKDVLGKVVTLNGSPNVIIGVLPERFQFAPAGRPGFWSAFHASEGCDLKRRCHSIFGVARLKDGVSLGEAVSNVQVIAQQLERQYPDSNRNQGANLVPLREVIAGEIRPVLMVLLDGAGLLMLIAAVNVTGLLLVRSEHRRPEFAMRKALGASLPRLVRQFVTEALILTFAAAAAGLAFAYWLVQLLPRLIPVNMMAQMPFLDGLGLSGRVVAVTAAIAVVMAGLLSLAPSTRILSRDLQNGSVDFGRTVASNVWRRVGSRLVVVELGTAIVLLTAAGLLGKSLYRLLSVNLGIDPNHLATIEVVAPPFRFGTDAKAIALERQLVGRIQALPGVMSVGVVVNGVPVSSNGNTTWFRVLGRPWHGEHYDAPQRYVSPGYFSTLRAKLLRGRYFNQWDDATKPRVAIVNHTLAARYFADEDPVGKQISILTNPPLPVQIVGVVDDIREGPLDASVPPVLYFPFEQSPDTDFTLVVRTSQAERALLPMLAATIRESDTSLVPVDGRTMNDRISDSESAYLHRSLVWVAGGFAVLALLLSAVGLYGVVAYSVSRRNREIGIRIALGAQRQSIFQLILSEAGLLIGFGMMIGIGCSFAATTLMRGMLFGVSSWDVPTLAAAAGVLGISALLASLVPARRAMRVDPIVALRYE